MNPDPAPPRGVEHAHVIDAIVHDAATDEVTLTMVERRLWDGSDLQVFQLQEKFNAYASFALDGEMAEAYPALAGKRLRVRLECVAAPVDAALDFLVLARQQLAFQHIDVEVVVSGGSCGVGCGCGA